jgi:DNA-directed RNA polymerase specialized sigma54-like protein
MNNTLTNAKLKENINLLDNMVLSCEKLTWIIDGNNISKEQKEFIETFLLTTKMNKEFIVNIVNNMVYNTKVNKKYLTEFKSSYEYVDECLEDLKSIFFTLPNNPDFKNQKNKYKELV